MAQDHAHWKMLLGKGGPSKGRDRPTEEPRKVFPGLGCLSGALKGGEFQQIGKEACQGKGPAWAKAWREKAEGLHRCRE